MKFIPEVALRSKIPEIVTSFWTEKPNKQQPQKGRSGKPNRESLNNTEIETVSIIEPKTYVLKDPYEYYKPKIGVCMADSSDSVTEIHIKSWKIEKPIMETLHDCLPYLSYLNTIKLNEFYVL